MQHTRPVFSLLLSLLACLTQIRAGEQTFPLGPLGGTAANESGQVWLVVKTLTPGGIGEYSGLKPGDSIVGVNGQPFEPAAENTDKCGAGPLETLGLAIDLAEATGATLKLNVKRAGKAITVEATLPRVGSFGANYPAQCPKSQAYYDGVCAYLAKTQHKNGSWGSPVTSSIAALALLGRSDTKYRKNADRYAEHLLSQLPNDSSNSNWHLGWMGVFLCEYYLATLDKRVPPILEKLVAVSIDHQHKEKGHFGHGTERPFAYDDKGLTATGTLVFWFWGMAGHCGVHVPEKNWNMYYEYLKTSAGYPKNGKEGESYIGYNHSCIDIGQSIMRTSHAAMALFVSGKDKPWAEQMGRHLASKTYYTLECHAVASPGIATSAPALFLTHPAGFRKHMDHWKWYFALSRAADNSAQYIPSRGNVGGDYYLNGHTWDNNNIVNACVGLALAASHGNLYIYGRFLNVEGVSYTKLPAELQSIYRDLMARKYTASALAQLQQRAEKALDESERTAAARLLAYVREQVVAPQLSEAQALADQGDLYQSREKLRSIEKSLGTAALAGNAQAATLQERFKDPANKKALDHGQAFYALLRTIEQGLDPKNRQFITRAALNQAIAKLRAEYTVESAPGVYRRMAQERLKALAPLVAPGS